MPARRRRRSCLQEGARAATGNIHQYARLGTNALVRRLKRIRTTGAKGGILVVTESLFSMHADVPDFLAIRLGESSLDLELRCSLKDVGTIVKTRSDLLLAVYAAFEREHIEIPYPQRDVNLRNVGELMDGLLWVKRQQAAEAQNALPNPASVATERQNDTEQ